MSFVREKLELLHILSTDQLKNGRDGDLVKVAGLVLVRQRPGTAQGICFITIEDETGVANLVVWENLFEQFRKEILQSRLLMVEGKLQIEGEVIHVIVQRCFNLTKMLKVLTEAEDENPPLLTLSRADEKTVPPDQARNKKSLAGQTEEQKIFYGGRNFR